MHQTAQHIRKNMGDLRTMRHKRRKEKLLKKRTKTVKCKNL
jgi:hypothetical protein